MDFLTQNQLAKYEEILTQIEIEHVKSQNLKREIDGAHNRLVISRLSKSKFKNCAIGHVSVKIFSDLFELCNLFQEEINLKEMSEFMKYENMKFYVVEIYITSVLLKMIENIDFYLNISVQSNDLCFYKSVELKNKLNNSPLFEVLAVNESVLDCKLSVSLSLPSDDTFSYINLDTVNVDVSYHFEMLKKPSKMSISRKVLEITKKYNDGDTNLVDLHRPLLLEYELLTTIDDKLFAQILLKNCYHKIDLELLSELQNESQSVFSIQLSTGTEKFCIFYDRSSKSVKIKSNFKDLCSIKKTFIQEMRGNGVGNKDIGNIILGLKTASRTQLGIDDVCNMYGELRKLWGSLPL